MKLALRDDHQQECLKITKRKHPTVGTMNRKMLGLGIIHGNLVFVYMESERRAFFSNESPADFSNEFTGSLLGLH